MYELTQAVAAASELEGIYDIALNALCENLGAEQSSILLFDEDRVMRFKAWRGLSDAYRQAVEGHTPWTPETQDPQPVLIPDVKDEPSLANLQEVIEAEGIRALAFIPLVAARKLLGKFMLYYPEPHAFSEEEVLLAQTMAGQVAFAIDQHNARTVLQESEELYRALVSGLAQAVYTTDAEGRILLYNEAAVELWGRRPEIGKDLWCGSWKIFTTDGELLPHQQCPMAVALKEGRDVRGVEIQVERPDGTRAFVLPSPSPLRDAFGRVIGGVNILVDITERKQAEQRLVLYGEIFANSKDGIAVIAPDGTYLEQNKAHSELLGYTAEELDGQTPAVHLGDKAFAELASELTERGEYRGEVESHTKDGRALTLDLSAFAVKDSNGVTTCYVGIKRDVTERKQAEDALQRSMIMKDQFLSLVSHELRTPISTILGNGLLLLTREEAIPPEDKKQAFADIVAEAEKLQENIEHLLLLTRLESSELEMESISLPSVVQRCVKTFKERHPERQINVALGTDLPRAVGQETLVALVVQNLLTNAAKYSPPEQPIEVLLDLAPSGQPEVRVRDHGIGLDEHDLSNLFAPFYRSTRARNQASGLGIGLAVCKRALEAQHGSISAEARQDGGADFYFTLTPAVSGNA
ncbi:MAG TPA: PAS domain S-box protein [Dehalococcoidia bacterium]|nr:PAS domain S-box protein [Dehalococcoidia bacterium]